MRFTIFVISSMVLLVSTILAVIVDLNKEWKHYQHEFKELETRKTESEIESLVKTFETDPEFKELEEAYKAAEAELNSSETISKQNQIKTEIDKIKYELYVAERDVKFTKSKLGALEFSIVQGEFDKQDVNSVIDDKRKLLDDLARQQQVVAGVKEKIAAKEAETAKIRENFDELKAKYDEKVMKLSLLERKLDSVKKRPIEIQQILIPSLNNTIDRCITCHVSINTDGFESKQYPLVFRTHPKRDLYLNKHNMKDFGCVVCHQGQGIATTKITAHGWVPFWDKPMLEGKQVESSCIKCHKSTDEIPADFFNTGQSLVQQSNCFACHKVEGQPAGPKNGPPLLQVSSKVNSSWMVNWVQNPRHYLPNSKMPTFKFSVDDAKAITAYLMSSSDNTYGERKNVVPNPSLEEEGKRVYQAKGCASCHAIKGVGATTGPDLGRVAGKNNPTWIFNWIKNPRSYHPMTIMPNLGLTDNEALAVVSYLSSMKWDNMPQIAVNINDQNEIEKGKELVKNYNCASCHNVPGVEGAQNAPELTGITEKDLHKFDFGYAHRDPERAVHHTKYSYIFNKIRNPWIYDDFVPPRMPRFWFSDEQTSAIYTYILGVTKDNNDIPYKYIYNPDSVEESNEVVESK